MLPQFTVTEAVDELLPVFVSPVALTVAVLVMDGQSCEVVVRVSVTLLLVSCAIVPKLQVSTPAVIEQLAASVPPSVHVPAGSVSETVTLVELPVPPAVTVIV